ncbi:MAG: phosphoribosylamine--glycine ligase [Kiritimatiellae bacterium]|nr:phosphoribosylamine--glycine ligase [Kiritimatiellia bacterium]MDW8457802.1 phosphoribosylamine--glycine ligase [Verrucomicrobiota bacterium]
MNSPLILIVGGGGREHALAWKLAQDSSKPRLVCAPGNAGTAEIAENLPISATDIDSLLAWATANKPDLTVVGPEAPLCAGIADRFIAAGLRVFGPTRDAARLEGSKIFAKEVLLAAGVPTARAAAFDDPAAARAHARSLRPPIVVKADGLAAGKGVVVCRSLPEAENAIHDAMVGGVFGEAGARLLIEEFLVGEEASVLALTDGEVIVPLATAQDHKRAFNRDEGPNTGGMGAYSPAPIVPQERLAEIRARIFEPVLRELRKRGIVYRGVLYAGLMVTSQGPHVLEFNCRFGDPETQAVLPLWEGDMLPALFACAEGGLRESHVRWRPGAAACVVMAAGGYPGSYRKGDPIQGLAEASRLPGVMIFHAGTALRGGQVVTDGGRVLGVTAVGEGLRQAVTRAYDAVARIRFANAHYRTDIGARALQRT